MCTLGSEVLRREARVVVDEVTPVPGKCIPCPRFGGIIGRIGYHNEVAGFQIPHVMRCVLTLLAQAIDQPKETRENPFALALRVDLLDAALATEYVNVRFSEAV